VGHTVSRECATPHTLCWSTRLRNELAPGFTTLLLPQAFTHDLSCESQSSPELRRDLAHLFADVPSLRYSEIREYVQANEEEFSSLAMSFNENYGFEFMSGGGRDYSLFNRTQCMLAYMSGLVMLAMSHAPEPRQVLLYLVDAGVLEKLWFFLLHWTDIALTAWPVLKLLEFFALDAHRSTHPEEVHLRIFGIRSAFDARPGDASADMWAAVRAPGRRDWMALATRAMTPPATPFGAASAHLAMVLAILEGGAEEGDAARAQWLLTAALSWLRAAPRRPSPPLQLLHSAWPVLALWGRIWRHPWARRLLGRRSQRCAIAFDARWTGRVAIVDGLLSSWLLGAPYGEGWRQLLVAPPAPSARQPGVAATQDAPSREAWASAVAFPSGDTGHAGDIKASAWVDAIRVLHASVRRYENPRSRRPFILVVGDELDADRASALINDGIELRSGQPIDLPPRIAHCSTLQRRAEGLRFRLWELVEFDRILYLDADMLVVGPLEHLFRMPAGVFASATINGTRWAYAPNVPLQDLWDPEDGADDNLGYYGRLQKGPPQINTGIMLISPSLEFLGAVFDVISVQTWEDAGGGWLDRCHPAELPYTRLRHVCANGVFIPMCAQGLTDAIYLALGRRLGDATFGAASEGHEDADREFLGCKSPQRANGQTLAQPTDEGEHCTLDETYNFQVTLPHLAWHMPHAQEFAAAGKRIRVLHWPGLPKPWTLAEGQRTFWDRMWWEAHDEHCNSAQDRGAQPCRLQCT